MVELKKEVRRRNGGGILGQLENLEGMDVVGVICWARDVYIYRKGVLEIQQGPEIVEVQLI